MEEMHPAPGDLEDRERLLKIQRVRHRRRFPGKLQIQKMLMRKYRMMRNGMTHHRQNRVQQRKIIVKGIQKKDDEGSEKDSPGIVTPDYSATTQEHKNGDTDVSEDPGTDSSQSTDNKTPSNGGGSSKKDGSGTEQNGSTEQPDTEVPTTEQPGVQSPTTTEQTSEDTVYTCTISINCSNILSNWDIFDKTKASCVPSDGWILREMTVEFKKGQTVFDVLKNVTRTRAIQMEYSFTALYGSYYIEGINNLYEFDCGELSGWEYCVNGKVPCIWMLKICPKDWG